MFHSFYWPIADAARCGAPPAVFQKTGARPRPCASGRAYGGTGRKRQARHELPVSESEQTHEFVRNWELAARFTVLDPKGAIACGNSWLEQRRRRFWRLPLPAARPPASAPERARMVV